MRPTNIYERKNELMMRVWCTDRWIRRAAPKLTSIKIEIRSRKE